MHKNTGKKSQDKEINKKIRLDLFYMSQREVSAKEIKDVLEKEEILVELWEELNVLQIDLPNGNTVDFEWIKNEFKDPSDASFIKNRDIKTIFAVTIEEEDFQNANSFFPIILNELEGFICTDSEEFIPIYQAHDFE